MSDTTVIAGSAPRTFRRFIERFPFLPALVILVVLLALNGLFEPNSLSYRAIRGLISTYLALILLSVAQTYVIYAADLDLSVATSPSTTTVGSRLTLPSCPGRADAAIACG